MDNTIPYRRFCATKFSATAFCLFIFAALQITLVPRNVSAQELSCPAPQQINVRFEGGTGWDMCWEARKRENIVLSEVKYTPANGNPLSVLAALRLAQLHVAYDDSNVTYNDITQFGLGAGYRTTLVEENCPGGDLIDIEGRAGLCKQISKGDDAYRTANESVLSQSLTLFSVSQVGSYAYIVTWKFYADGTIAPSVGAAGALQRSSDFVTSPYGRQLEGVTDKSWLSHTHNYYWQMDFDLGASATDDVVSEISYPLDNEGRRARTVVPILREAAKAIQPDKMLSWQISDSALDRLDGPSYLIEPLHYGHKLVRTLTEPFTDYDFFVTRQNDCEDFISENAKYNPDCDENIMQFINDETLEGEDITLWHRVSFHHLPRNEDRRTMHSHWDGFTMQARNVNRTTPGHSGTIYNAAPVITSPGDQINTAGQSVDLALQVSDADNDVVQITVSGLPDGLSIDASGMISGQLTTAGTYTVGILAADADETASASFSWQVDVNENPESPDGVSGGSGAIAWWWLLMLSVFGYKRGHKEKNGLLRKASSL